MGLRQTDQKGIIGWFDQRFPLMKTIREHMTEYYAPKNFNFWYFFGFIATLVLVIQIVSGIFLTMNFKPNAALAFDSVEYIMRDVPWGWLIRYVHSTGASAFFIVVYLHMFRGLMYGSYRKPRELIWIFGMIIYVALMAEAFMGYLLPWGQMSYWGAQVIINLFNTIPFIGEDLALWIRGDYSLADATLNRFFAFHVIAVPLILALLVFLHIVALHAVGSNNPDGVEIKDKLDKKGVPLDGIPFHPYIVLKDFVAIVVFLILASLVVFYAPELGGYFLEHANFEPANPLATPEHIAPVWYFTPFYAILRAVPSMFGSAFPGVIAMGAAIIVLFMLPWIDRSPVKSIRYKGMLSKLALALFVVSFIVLGIMGVKAVSPDNTIIARAASFLYFGFFLAMPIYSAATNPKSFFGIAVAGLITVFSTIIFIILIVSWLMNPDASYLVKIPAILITTFSYAVYLIIPLFFKNETTKPVPDRVTI